MSLPKQQLTADGEEIQVADWNCVAEEAAKAEDYVLAEMLRLSPLNGSTVSKAILPYGYFGQANAAMVQPNGASGSVLLMPFRVAVGSRTALGATTNDAAGDTTAQLAWRDVRSAVYAVSDNGSSFGHAVTFASNASGNPRWDLVYATLTVDANAAQVTRFVKAPLALVGVPQSEVTQIVQTITINVLAGTTNASPQIPAIPADSAGVYNVPICAVQIPNGFGGASTVAAQQIAMLAPVVPVATSTSTLSVAPATINSTITTSIAQAWGAGSAVRPNEFLPSSMVGGASRFLLINGFAHADASVLDSSIDWRNRYFITFFQWQAAGNTAAFASKHGATQPVTPKAPTNTDTSGNVLLRNLWEMGQSFVVDDNAIIGITTRNGATVMYVTNTMLAGVDAAKSMAVYVDTTNGNLKLYNNMFGGGDDVASMVAMWLFATAPMDNV